jgi:hypothetical protein
MLLLLMLLLLLLLGLLPRLLPRLLLLALSSTTRPEYKHNDRQKSYSDHGSRF